MYKFQLNHKGNRKLLKGCEPDTQNSILKNLQWEQALLVAS